MRNLAIVGLAMLIVPALSATPVYTIIDLGAVSGTITGMSINQFGEIAGYGTDASGNLYAFTATISSGSTNITPTWASGGSAAYSVNSSGQVVGTSYVNGNAVATTWSDGTASKLGGLGGTQSYATAVNDSGVAVGQATDSSGAGHAVIYSSGSVEDISLPGSAWSSAYAINSSGTVAGYALESNGTAQAYTWSSSGGYTTLATLGGKSSYAFGINDSGEVVGSSTNKSGYSHAAAWTSSGVTDLGTLGGSTSSAYDVNNTGSIVGYSSVSGSSVTHAFLYVDGEMLDLNSLATNIDGWVLIAAYAINDSGEIVGIGLLNGVMHLFVLEDPPSSSVPEPGTLGMFLMGVAALSGGALLRRRRR